MLKVSRLCVSLIFIFFFSCLSLESVKFEKLVNTRIIGISGQDITIQTEAQFFNPNKIKGLIKDISIDVSIKDQIVAHLMEESKVKVMQNERFTVPLQLTIKLKSLKNDLLSNLINLVKTRKIELTYTGYISIRSFGIGYKIPIDYQEELEIKL